MIGKSEKNWLKHNPKSKNNNSNDNNNDSTIKTFALWQMKLRQQQGKLKLGWTYWQSICLSMGLHQEFIKKYCNYITKQAI
jgi:hypothetical protein